MNVNETLDSLLMRVEKPARYIGGELYSVVKDPQSVATRFAFAFPDMYEIGMSYLGLQIIYHVLNKEEDVACERVFAPAPDMEAEMRRVRLPLYTLETKTPLSDMDIIGFTLQYEMSFTNILNTLKGIADVVLGWFGTSWNEVWTSIKDFFVNIWTSISTFFTGIITGIRDFFVNIWTGIYTFFSNIFNYSFGFLFISTYK